MEPGTNQKVSEIKRLAGRRTIRLMEVCGTHTVAISRFGLRRLLAPEIELISGPGCPVCVTPAEYIAKAVYLAQEGFVVATFGDMMKVPVNNTSLFDARAAGADVRVVYNPLEAVEIARQNPDRQVVFLGVGFETTAPTFAGAIKVAAQSGIENFSVLCGAKTIPMPLRIIASSPDIAVDGFILPGHVSAIIGAEPYRFLAEEFGLPGVITGFEAEDIIDGIWRLVKMIAEERAEIEISYSRVVTWEGNRAAQNLLAEIFEPCDSAWRGIGILPQSGLKIREKYADFDAQVRFGVPDFPDAQDNPACQCDRVIMGRLKPTQCPLFGKSCTPENPQGPCMISSEGACAAYYKYGE